MVACREPVWEKYLLQKFTHKIMYILDWKQIRCMYYQTLLREFLKWVKCCILELNNLKGKYEKRLLLKCLHNFKSDLINYMEHMRISGSEPSSKATVCLFNKLRQMNKYAVITCINVKMDIAASKISTPV